MEFDDYGRTLALREMVRTRRIASGSARALLNPVSCVRYLEFDFAARALPKNAASSQRVLDVSSPRLFPFWLAEKRGFNVTMINPDPADIEETRKNAKYVDADGRLVIADFKLTGAGKTPELPFPDSGFDAVTSISVIEHVGDAETEKDNAMIRELVRIVRPGGSILLTFPVKPKFENEFRQRDYYGTQGSEKSGGRFFFQRFYDEKAIADRLLAGTGVSEVERRYFVEEPVGWFADYEGEWMRNGLLHTVGDPWFMAQHFRDGGKTHPRDRLGVCGLVLQVEK